LDIQEIISKVDHTLLSQTATWEEIKAICDDGVKYGAASVCIPPPMLSRLPNTSAAGLGSARL
jgi:deoxyribose-phosphate aldolase